MISSTKKITLVNLFKQFYVRMSVTWALVLLENFMMALIPLLIGYAIDDLLSGKMDKLLLLSGNLIILTIVAVLRRIYDTRAYSAIKVKLGIAVDDRHRNIAVSSRNARLDMSRELIDFLEQEVPALITSFVQVIVAIVILFSFHANLAFSALAATLGMISVYALFHKRFYKLNSALNSQVEQQVSIMEKCSRLNLLRHLRVLRSHEIKLSDTEAFTYGLIFLLQIGFIIFNLWQSTALPAATAGMIFSIVSYSWEYVEAALILPMALQQWTRLHEITERINNTK